MSADFDAVVVGAGPAGATAALLLARAGWSVALLERQIFPRRKVCGECVAASNLPLLDALGIGAEFDRLAGAELRRVALMRGGKTIVATLPPAESGRHRYGRALGREHLDTLLVAAAEAAGAALLQPFALRAIEGRAGDFRLELRGPEAGAAAVSIRAALVVAAHGSWEPLPFERAERRDARAAHDLFAFKANFRHAALAADLLPVLAFDGGYGGMVVADDGIATLAGCLREDRLQQLRAAQPGTRAGDVFEQMLRRDCAGVADALAPAMRAGAWLASGPLRPGVRLRADDEVFRIGNAAGEAHPIVGEGISMALQSAFLLAELIAPERSAIAAPSTSAGVQARLLALHGRRWRHHFARRLRIAAVFAHVAMRPALAEAAWPLVQAWPGLLTQGARWSGKTRSAADPQALAKPIAAHA